MKKAFPPKFKYQVLIPGCAAPCEVEAECTEKACQILLSRGGAAPAKSREAHDRLQLNTADLPERWIIMRMTPPEYCDYLLVQEWNGSCFKSIGKAAIGADILQAAAKFSRAPAILKRPSSVNKSPDTPKQ